MYEDLGTSHCIRLSNERVCIMNKLTGSARVKVKSPRRSSGGWFRSWYASGKRYSQSNV